jgi:ankyrin repeat protein
VTAIPATNIQEPQTSFFASFLFSLILVVEFVSALNLLGMEGIVFDASALRRDYRDSIAQLPNTAVHRKNVDDDMLAESCYICLRGWEIGEEMTTLRCECLSWAHEACLAKSVFETGGCPTCRKSIFLIDDEMVLARSAADGDTEKLRRLLDSGIQHSLRGFLDSTPLLQAAENGQRETIRLLLERGASISEQDGLQRTALHFASAGGHAEAADELLLHGADISPVNKKGQAFLHLAVLSRSTEIVAVLLDKGAVVSAQDLEGGTALHLAADQGHREMINLLIDRGAEVELVDKLGRIPLHHSARLGYGAATKLLVERGLMVTTEDNDGRTARDLAEGSDRAIKALNGEEPDFYIYEGRMILL